MDTSLIIRPVEPKLWPDFEKLFEERGGPKNCWCMIWRDYSRSNGANDKDSRKAGMRARIGGGKPVGLLAYLDNAPVAWCSVAPRHSFKASLDGQAAAVNEDKWSLTCLFVKRAHRGAGISDSLIEAANDYARTCGATRLEAYPVASDSPSYRFCGFVGQFDRHGFVAEGRVGSRRNIVCKTL